MANVFAFDRYSAASLIAGTTTASAPEQIGTATSRTYRFTNLGPDYAFICLSDQNVPATAVIPTGLANGNSTPLVPGATEFLTCSPKAWVSIICPTSTAAVYVAPGEGL